MYCHSVYDAWFFLHRQKNRPKVIYTFVFSTPSANGFSFSLLDGNGFFWRNFFDQGTIER